MRALENAARLSAYQETVLQWAPATAQLDPSAQPRQSEAAQQLDQLLHPMFDIKASKKRFSALLKIAFSLHSLP